MADKGIDNKITRKLGHQIVIVKVITPTNLTSKQKEALNKTILQANEFYNIYENEITYPLKRDIYLFSRLNQFNWFKRRYVILSKGFLKTGFLRNIGLLLII